MYDTPYFLFFLRKCPGMRFVLLPFCGCHEVCVRIYVPRNKNSIAFFLFWEGLRLWALRLFNRLLLPVVLQCSSLPTCPVPCFLTADGWNIYTYVTVCERVCFKLKVSAKKFLKFCFLLFMRSLEIYSKHSQNLSWESKWFAVCKTSKNNKIRKVCLIHGGWIYFSIIQCVSKCSARRLWIQKDGFCRRLLSKLIQRITGTVVQWDRRNKVTQLNDRAVSRKKMVLSQPRT